eukprot:7273750-Pyramimonas_sp.AAC.1
MPSRSTACHGNSWTAPSRCRRSSIAARRAQGRAPSAILWTRPAPRTMPPTSFLRATTTSALRQRQGR